MDIINEEEEHFLKSLSVGRRKFEEALQKVDNNILPGNVMVGLSLFTLFNYRIAGNFVGPIFCKNILRGFNFANSTTCAMRVPY